MRAHGDADRFASFPGIQADVDLVLVVVAADGKQRSCTKQPIEVLILDVCSLLEAGIVLLKGIAVLRVIEKEREVGVEVKE